MKIEQRKVRGPKREPQVKQAALLASPIYIGQAHGEEIKHIKRGEGIQPPATLLFASFGQPTLTPQGCISFACQIKLSCNTGPSIASNLTALRQNKEIINSPDNTN